MVRTQERSGGKDDGVEDGMATLEKKRPTPEEIRRRLAVETWTATTQWDDETPDLFIHAASDRPCLGPGERQTSSISDDDRCECGARETVIHVLVDCPLLSELWKELRQRIGDSFKSVATMLGGDATRRGGPINQPVDRAVVIAVIEFAEK